MVTFQSFSAVCCESRFRFRSVRSVRRVGGGSYGGGYSDDSGTSIGKKEFQLTTTSCCNTGIFAYKQNLNMFFIILGAIIGGIVGGIVLLCVIASCVNCCSDSCNKSHGNKNQGQVWSVHDEHVQGLPPYMESKGEAPPYNMATQGYSPPDGLATPENYPPYNGATLEGGAPYMTANGALPYPAGYTNDGLHSPQPHKQL